MATSSVRDETKTGGEGIVNLFKDPVWVVRPEKASTVFKMWMPALAAASGVPDLMMVSGLPGSGKTTLIRFLKDVWGKDVVVLNMDNVTRAYLEKDVASLSAQDQDVHQARCKRVREGMKKLLVNAQNMHFILESAIREVWKTNPAAGIALDGFPRSCDDVTWAYETFPALVKKLNVCCDGKSRDGENVVWCHIFTPIDENLHEMLPTLAHRIAERDSINVHERESTAMSAKDRIQKEIAIEKNMFNEILDFPLDNFKMVAARADVDCSSLLALVAMRLALAVGAIIPEDVVKKTLLCLVKKIP